ncbi:hypothetical protein Lfu02_75140 [Longispora fulva]|uniref:GH25 family lysozyme M1 (1,4-beta-N-acetylmuramidase) n=1 Tax=Longispora fulva TaxID=619741 RepID=A0A8J7KDP3_9ACTN|nr:GH25 family lysozyme [Longispora fulva]MBG6134250.1 GH25 family lysozyme M1 (1,4-beta-N-acetylmuramidase) [Longispora fulva]GIG63142.1 hypothetical protein Lfu02_75140 [Longispora fulva]
MTVWIADISNWQGDINAAGIVAEGYAAVVCKATEGGDYTDPWFDTYIPEIIGAGGIPGAYHYLRAGDGGAQARRFLDRIRAHGGPDGWLVQLDCEADGGPPEMAAFMAEWNAATGDHPVLIYSGAWWWDDHTGGFDGSALTPYLWHSHYVDGSGYGSRLYESVPGDWWTPGYGGWDTATILQFSSHGRVAGQDIDVSAYRGSLDDLRVLTRAGTPTPIPPDPDAGGSVSDLSYAPFGKPAVVGDRAAGVMLADLWGAVALESSPYQANTPFPLVARLQRIEATVNALAADIAAIRAAQATGDVDVNALAAALAPHLPAAPTAAEVATAVRHDAAAHLARD